MKIKISKIEALKIKKENIAELKSQRDKIQEKYDLLKHSLDHLPDEVQLNIFKFLDFDDIIRCAQVSKRTRRICHDKSIWKKVNISGKTVPSEFMEQILENGCQYINLNNTKIVGGLNLSRNDYNVKYLDLRYHLASKHGVSVGETSHDCDICKKKFAFAFQLKKHNDHVHKDLKIS